MNSVAAIAGSISTALFIASTLPMLWKAARTAVTSGEARGVLDSWIPSSVPGLERFDAEWAASGGDR